MAYVSEFKYDIYVSYARVDNLSLAREGWVDSFCRSLEDRLDKLIGRIGSVTVWRDDKGVLNENLAYQGREAINSSAIFLSLLSRGYLRSNYCMEELTTFSESARSSPRGLVVDGKSRIFNVLLQDIPLYEWPQELSGQSGFQFYDSRFGHPIPPDNKNFGRLMLQLSREISIVLKSLKGLPQLVLPKSTTESRTVTPPKTGGGLPKLALPKNPIVDSSEPENRSAKQRAKSHVEDASVTPGLNDAAQASLTARTEETRPLPSEIEIFISFKNLDDSGEETRDCAIARNLASFLREQGFSVFFSLDSLERTGTSAYKKAIDNALERSTILIAVGTTHKNLTSRWVEYEWDSFLQDLIEGFKPRGEVFTVIENMSPQDLPRGLRQRQVFRNSGKELARMANFIRSKLTTGKS